MPQTRRRVLALEDEVENTKGQLSRARRELSHTKGELFAIAQVVRAFLEDRALKAVLKSEVDAALEIQMDEVVQLVSEGDRALESQVDQVARRVDEVPRSVDEVVAGRVDEVARRLDEVARGVDEVKRVLQAERASRQRAFTDFERRLAIRGLRPASEPQPDKESAGAPSATSVQSALESFYFLLEDRYRGSREEIKQGLLVYRNDLRSARDRTGFAGPVIDIGCGRGELLEMLREDGFQGIGVDANDTQLETARNHGGAVVHGDAFEYLRSLDAGSVLAVTGIHIVEHIPFRDLVRLMQEVVRVLQHGGVAIFETPNPRNLIVGATTFNLDPTHIKPLPMEVLQVLLETVGFEQIEIRPLHPSDTLESMVKYNNMDRHLATLLFGPQDYAIVGVID